MKTTGSPRNFLLAVATLIIVVDLIAPDRRLAAQPAGALSPQVSAQIAALASEKASRTPAQLKMDSRLVYAAKMARGERIASNVSTLRISFADMNARGVVVDVRADVTDRLLDQLRALGADVLNVSAIYRSIHLRIGLSQVEAVAALPNVTYVQASQQIVTSRERDGSRRSSASRNLPDLRTQKRLARADVIGKVQQAVIGDQPVFSVGSRNSEGDTTHRAAAARTSFGASGAGVKVGVLSNGVTNLAASQAAGDLGAVTVLPGQTGSGDEGTAMLEIIHDLAPNAQLFFATALGGPAVFAQNIRDLYAAGCTIIVDDVGYVAESPFQDGQVGTSQTNGGIVTQAVKDVANAGTLYFSAAANSGNKNDNTSGTWEGDFVDGGAATGPLAGLGQVHNFGGLTYNSFLLNNGNGVVALFWSDPLGGSGNDYDLYILDSTGTSVLDVSNGVQSGTQDPFEGVVGSFAGERAVIVKFSGAGRFLHLDTGRNQLQISTPGSTHGHSATSAVNSFGVAATPAQNPGPFPGAFNGSNIVEPFSSDGPRRIFFNSFAAPFTPGNVSSTGGVVLQKPDFTAADGVSVTGVGGLPSPFFGTSAAAPHAAAIAALVKSRNPNQTAAQVRAALFSSVIDIEAPGIDRDSGYGILMADVAVLNGVPRPRVRPGDFDGNGRADLAVFRPSTGRWFISDPTTGVSASPIWGGAGDIPVAGDFDGDGKNDVTVFRPSTGNWFIILSSTGGSASATFGGFGDVPVPGDYNGDGITDIAVFRPTTGQWFLPTGAFVFGGNGDIPVPGDYNGDGFTDIGVFRPSTGAWFLGTGASFVFGGGGDVPVPGDYDGDGRTDIGVFRRTTGSWFLGTGVSYTWGGGSDNPVPGDYDGDGKTDVAVFRPSTGQWFIIHSSTSTSPAFTFGGAGDIPVLKR